MKSELINILKRFTKPITGLAIVGVSTTLVACYGAYEPEPQGYDPEYCEAMILKACTDANMDVPAECERSAEEVERICADSKKESTDQQPAEEQQQ